MKLFSKIDVVKVKVNLCGCDGREKKGEKESKFVYLLAGISQFHFLRHFLFRLFLSRSPFLFVDIFGGGLGVIQMQIPLLKGSVWRLDFLIKTHCLILTVIPFYWFSGLLLEKRKLNGKLNLYQSCGFVFRFPFFFLLIQRSLLLWYFYPAFLALKQFEVRRKY